jgi:hypothetical protein
MKALYILVAVAEMYLSTFAMAQVSLETLRTCLDVEDQSKERLNCYDEKIEPAPKPVSTPAKTVQDCRFVKEEDERLNCFNRFVNPPPKNTAQQKLKNPPTGTMPPGPAPSGSQELPLQERMAQDRQACGADVQRLCNTGSMPKPGDRTVINCLLAHKTELSEACRKNVESHAPPPNATR